MNENQEQKENGFFGLIYDERMMDHRPAENDGTSHPERPRRIQAIWDKLVQEGITIDPRVTLLQPRRVEEKELLRCHDARYLDKVRGKMGGGSGRSGLRGDMYSSTGTLLAAELAAGSSIVLAEEIAQERITSGFAIVRPPGHHAKCGAYGGFCFFNNAMLAATHLTEKGLRVYVVDWDVHLGDGSIGIMKSALQKHNNLLRYFSIHRWDCGRFYPGGTGGESGRDARGRVLKVGFWGGQGDDYFIDAFKETLMPDLLSFAPDVIIVSAGFDAARGDPLGNCDVTPLGYSTLLVMLKEVTPRIGLILEGGYNLDSISASALACVQTMLSD